jgi:hypothetical protein
VGKYPEFGSSETEKHMGGQLELHAAELLLGNTADTAMYSDNIKLVIWKYIMKM